MSAEKIRLLGDYLGGYSGLFVDPDGHPWGVAGNPHWTIDEDGSVRLD